MAKLEKTTKAKAEKISADAEGKLKAIQTAMGQIEKKYGKEGAKERIFAT